MPDFGGGHSMNPAVARAKAKAAGVEPEEELEDKAEAGQDDELIPDGHQLSDGPNVSPADNGYSVRHTTKPKKLKKDEDEWKMRKEHHHVFPTRHKAASHVSAVLAAHEASRE